MASGTIAIYALVQPGSKPPAYRYVGKANDPRERLKTHRYKARHRREQPVNDWMKHHLDLGHEPEMVVLETCPVEGWADRERHWIAKLRAEGHALLNLSEGGENPPNRTGAKNTPEHIAATRAAHVGAKRSPDSRERIRRTAIESRMQPPRWAIEKAATNRRGKQVSPITIERRRATNRAAGPQHEEARRAAISKGQALAHARRNALRAFGEAWESWQQESRHP